MEDASAELLGVELLDRGQFAALRHRRQLELGGLPLGDQRGVQRLRVGGRKDAVDHGLPDNPDLPVELGDVGLQRSAVVRDGVRRVGQRDDRTVDQRPHVVRGEDLAGDVLQQAGVHDVHADGQPGAVLAVVLPGRADVVVVVCLSRASAYRHANAAAARSASHPGREQAAFTEADRVVAVAALALGVVAELPDRLDPRELLIGDGGGVGVAGDDLAVVHDVAGVHRAGEELLDVLAVPGAAEPLSGHVSAAGRIDGLAGELLGEALSAVAAVEVLGEHPFDRREVGHRVVRDHQAPGFEGVAERGVSVLPVSLFCLGVHPALHVAGQFLRVALGQPREDRTDQLAEGLVSGVRLGQRDHIDVGLIERCEGLEAIHHVPGDAGKCPDVQAIHALSICTGPHYASGSDRREIAGAVRVVANPACDANLPPA